ncbi:hypothetical protein F2981_32320 (plasmid) [Sinorhizobium meliloti]|nr:hypothetical protein [Sinorhizobium meliloti]
MTGVFMGYDTETDGLPAKRAADSRPRLYRLHEGGNARQTCVDFPSARPDLRDVTAARAAGRFRRPRFGCRGLQTREPAVLDECPVIDGFGRREPNSLPRCASSF